jgi:hypothetical protein
MKSLKGFQCLHIKMLSSRKTFFLPDSRKSFFYSVSATTALRQSLFSASSRGPIFTLLTSPPPRISNICQLRVPRQNMHVLYYLEGWGYGYCSVYSTIHAVCGFFQTWHTVRQCSKTHRCVQGTLSWDRMPLVFFLICNRSSEYGFEFTMVVDCKTSFLGEFLTVPIEHKTAD